MATGHFLALATGAFPGVGTNGYLLGAAFGNYPTAHNAANASSVTNGGTELFIGQRRYYPGGILYMIWRGGLFFDTSYLSGMTLTGAELRFGGAEHIPNIAFDLCVVSGQDLQVPLVAADYGELLDEITSFGSITVPVGGFDEHFYQTINLSPAGLAQINPLGVTKFGLRSLPDINAIPPPVGGGFNDDEWLKIGGWNRFYNFIKTSPATGIHATSATLHGRIDEAGSSNYLVPDLVVYSNAAVDFSNCDFRFVWDEVGVWPAGNYTPWKLNQPWYTDISDNIGGLLPNTQYWFVAQMRCSGIVETDGDTRVFTTPPLPLVINKAYALSREEL